MCAIPVFLSSFPYQMTSFAACLSVLYATPPEASASHRLLWSSVLWEHDTSCVCAAELHHSEVEGKRGEQELISDMSQLEESNSEKAFPTCKKQRWQIWSSLWGHLAFPSKRPSIYTVLDSTNQSPLGKEMSAEDLLFLVCPCFALANQGIGLVLFLQAKCADCRCKLVYSPLAKDFRIR